MALTAQGVDAVMCPTFSSRTPGLETAALAMIDRRSRSLCVHLVVGANQAHRQIARDFFHALGELLHSSDWKMVRAWTASSTSPPLVIYRRAATVNRIRHAEAGPARPSELVHQVFLAVLLFALLHIVVIKTFSIDNLACGANFQNWAADITEGAGA